MSNKPKSMFLSRKSLAKDDLSRSLGADFSRDPYKSYKMCYQQGFDGTGKYFFILMDEFEETEIFLSYLYTTIYMCCFDDTCRSIEKKKLRFSIPYEFNCERSSLLFPYHGKIVHTVQDENVVHLYYLDVFDLLDKFDQSDELIVIEKKPDFTLNYDYELYTGKNQKNSRQIFGWIRGGKVTFYTHF